MFGDGDDANFPQINLSKVKNGTDVFSQIKTPSASTKSKREFSTPAKSEAEGDQTPYKVILLGNSFSGKTSIINKYITGEFFKSRKETTQIDMLSYTQYTDDD